MENLNEKSKFSPSSTEFLMKRRSDVIIEQFKPKMQNYILKI